MQHSDACTLSDDDNGEREKIDHVTSPALNRRLAMKRGTNHVPHNVQQEKSMRNNEV